MSAKRTSVIFSEEGSSVVDMVSILGLRGHGDTAPVDTVS